MVGDTMKIQYRLMMIIVILFFLIQNTVSITKDEALSRIIEIEEDVHEMEEMNFPTSRVKDLLVEAGLVIQRAEFAELVRNSEEDNISKEALKALEGLDYLTSSSCS